MKLDIGVEVGPVAAEAPNDGAVGGGDLVQRESATAGNEVVAVRKFVDGVEVAENAAVSTLEEYEAIGSKIYLQKLPRHTPPIRTPLLHRTTMCIALFQANMVR